MCYNMDRTKEEEMCIRDSVDAVREIAPEEWKIMKCKDIFGLMVCPLICQGRLFGFFELDNPKSLTSERYLLQGIADYLAEDLSKRGYFQSAQTEEAGKIRDTMQQNEILELTQLGPVSYTHLVYTVFPILKGYCRLSWIIIEYRSILGKK